MDKPTKDLPEDGCTRYVVPMKLEQPAHVLNKADKDGLRRVLVVTALPSEMAAVRKHTKHIASCQGRDGNIYELGQFTGTRSNWLVVVGESGAGNHPSQSVVTNASIDFGPFELILFVGVAATRKADDAPIGSVVISSHVYLASVGKYKDGEFFSRAREFPISPRLLGFGKKVVRDERWHERLHPPYAEIMPDHIDYPKPFPPPAVVAPIVSTEAVSADVDSVLEKQITAAYQDATALEMEGYGVLYAAFNETVPCIVIRGISDDRAGKNPVLDKIHQPIAAAHGAAFAYELVDLWGENQPSTAPTQASSASGDTPFSSFPEQAAQQAATNFVPADLTPTQVDASSDQVTFVLKFAGTKSDFPPAKQQQIIEVLQVLTGDENLSLVDARAGSFYLIVRGGAGTLALLRSLNPVEELSKQLDLTLLDTLTETEFELASSDLRAVTLASKPLMDWPKTLPDGTSIDRPELARLLAVTDDEGTTKALLGDPGSGKSALLASLANTLRNSEIPFLAIKSDLLDPNVINEDGLKSDLGLPARPSTILRRLSKRGPVFLIIDQLDALAGYVDLRTGRLSALLNLIRELGFEKNIHIVLSARRFEYEHDTRLKTVRAESVFLELPPWSTALQILEANEIQAAGWPVDAQQVMRSPQALATFLRFADPTTAEPFSKYQKMLERLWSERLLSRSDGKRLSKLSGVIAEDMAERETLWLARSRYDEFADDLKTLEAETIITSPAGSPGSIGFSHQTVFEFALARSFAQREGRLSSYVSTRETSLFIRPKLWAALTYLRDVEVPTYETELRTIWSRSNLRPHLKHLLIEFLGQQSEPMNSEFEVMLSALKSDDRRTALQAIVGSKGWFTRFSNTEIANAMLSAHEAGVASVILARATDFAPTDVLLLIQKHWLPTKEFDGQSWHVLQDVQTWTEEHLELASNLVDRTQIAAFSFDHMVSTVGSAQPILALRLVLAKLKAVLRSAKEEADSRKRSNLENVDSGEGSSIERYMTSAAEAVERILEQSDGWDSLESIAKTSPNDFLTILWPWFQTCLETIKQYKEDTGSELSFPLPYGPDFRFEDEGTLDLPEPSLLGAFRTAAEFLAAQSPDEFLQWLSIANKDDAAPSQRLQAHALASQPQRFASEYLAFLISDTRRFNLGSVEDLSGTTKRTLAAVSPHWDGKQIEEFINAVISYAPRPEGDRDPKNRQYFYRIVEQIRFELLSLLPSDRLNAEAQAVVQQGERKFFNTKRGATFSGVQWIGSPMSADEIGLATQDAILNAFEALPDATGWDNPKTWMKGGNVQLSRSFADFSKTNPAKAIEVLSRFTPEIGNRAAGYAIDAMAEKEPGELLLPLIQELERRGFGGEEYRGSVARAVEKLINREIEIGDGTLALLQSWLLITGGDDRISDEKSEEITDGNNENDKDDTVDSVLWGMGGVSILPHGNFPILEAVTRILLHRKDYAQLLSILTEHLGRPERQRIWSALMRLFPYIHAEPDALIPFYKMLLEKYPELSKERETVILLAHLHWKIPDFVRDVLVHWQNDSAPFVQQSFGELATLVWLMHPTLAWPQELIDTILNGDIESPARTGATFAAIHVWVETENKQRAASLLQQLISDATEATWKAATDIFRLVDDITPDQEWAIILQAIADEIPNHKTFNSTFIVDRLQTLLPHEATLVATIAKALVTKWQVELGDMRTGTAAIAPELVDIAITLHRLGTATREIGLEIFESLLNINAYTARETLDQVDNRFRSSIPPRRTRLPRRQRRVRRRQKTA